MKLIVAGSRGFKDYDFLCSTLDKFLEEHKGEDIEFISGAATGADTMGGIYATDHGYNLKEFPAQWEVYGRSAGYIRNSAMLKYACSDENPVLFAFWDGQSRGTAHIIKEAEKLSMEVHVCTSEEV